MLTRQVPASTILVDAQPVTGRYMPSEHLAAPAAFDADDVIAVNGPSNRNSGCSLFVEFGYRFTKGCEGLMNSRDQCGELVGSDEHMRRQF
jgi:hypothetical protein